MNTRETPELLTTEEACQFLRVSRAAMYRRIEDGSIPSVRLTATGAIRIPRRELERRLFEKEN